MKKITSCIFILLSVILFTGCSTADNKTNIYYVYDLKIEDLNISHSITNNQLTINIEQKNYAISNYKILLTFWNDNFEHTYFYKNTLIIENFAFFDITKTLSLNDFKTNIAPAYYTYFIPTHFNIEIINGKTKVNKNQIVNEINFENKRKNFTTKTIDNILAFTKPNDLIDFIINEPDIQEDTVKFSGTIKNNSNTTKNYKVTAKYKTNTNIFKLIELNPQEQKNFQFNYILSEDLIENINLIYQEIFYFN